MKQRFEITVQHSHRVHIDHPDGSRSWTSERLPDTQELVEIEIDLQALAAEYGSQAFKNKSGRSRLAGGLIEFRNVSKLRRIA